jgi:predicted enzyme related to lactoylglutathione lyase
MPQPAPGQVSFLEIGSADAAALRAFFGAVFGWPSHDDAWMQGPTMKVGTHGDDPAPQIYVYFNVADLEEATEQVRFAGGQTEAPTDEPGFGRFVNCVGPGGLAFGLHTPPASAP